MRKLGLSLILALTALVLVAGPASAGNSWY